MSSIAQRHAIQPQSALMVEHKKGIFEEEEKRNEVMKRCLMFALANHQMRGEIHKFHPRSSAVTLCSEFLNYIFEFLNTPDFALEAPKRWCITAGNNANTLTPYVNNLLQFRLENFRIIISDVHCVDDEW